MVTSPRGGPRGGLDNDGFKSGWTLVISVVELENGPREDNVSRRSISSPA